MDGHTDGQTDTRADRQTDSRRAQKTFGLHNKVKHIRFVNEALGVQTGFNGRRVVMLSRNNSREGGYYQCFDSVHHRV